MTKILNRAIRHPQVLFLIDGIGAAVSAILLGLVLPMVQAYIGLPLDVLYVLAAIPCLFVLYDLFVYVRAKKAWVTYLQVIAVLNGLYCLLSLALVFYHYDRLTYVGLFYFFSEIVIVLLLAWVEWKTAQALKG